MLSCSLPIRNEIRLLRESQNTTDQSISITLRRVTIAPTQTRFIICFLPPAPERTWTAIPYLKADGAEVAGGGGVQPIIGVGEAVGEICNEFLYNVTMFDYTGTWQLEITELVGFGSSGSDQQRIMGSWKFEFVVLA